MQNTKKENLQLALNFAKKFKVPDKRYYIVKIKALTRTHQWDALQSFSSEKKNPPCGFKPFAIACWDENERKQAELYASKITTPEQKFDTLIYMEMYSPALEVAIKLKDPEKLTIVRNYCTDPAVLEEIDLAAQQLGFIG